MGWFISTVLFVRSAPTAAEATSFEFVARQKDGNEPVGEPDPSSPGGRDASDGALASAATSLVALRAADGSSGATSCG